MPDRPGVRSWNQSEESSTDCVGDVVIFELFEQAEGAIDWNHCWWRDSEWGIDGLCDYSEGNGS